MPTIVKEGEIVDSDFRVIWEEDAAINENNALLPLSTYIDNAESLKGRNDIGVWLDSHEEVETLEPFLDQLPIVALNFPQFHDGRSLSNATILRHHYAFAGEVRAIGDVRRDLVNQMYRCGFNAFEPAEDQTPEDIVSGLKGFTYNYQASIDRPVPLFRLRE
ncbi:MAG: DUF934 domain-containing protein [Pseudomonadales bacterium]